VAYSIVPWLILYHATSIIGVPQGTFSTNLPFEEHLRVWEWSIFLYETSYPAVAVAPFVARTRNALRRFCMGTLVGSAIAYPLYWTLPGLAPRRPFLPETLLGRLLDYERGTLPPVAAFPSFHVIWSLVCAELFAATWPRARWFWRAWAWSVALSCVTTSMHTIADVVAGFLAGWVAIHYDTVWRVLVRAMGSATRAGLLLWNVFVTLLVGRLAFIGAPPALTAGVFLFLEGASVYVVAKRR
jgi:membrane-associated phospholipid phosphatase